jgi:hypothetical protein
MQHDYLLIVFPSMLHVDFTATGESESSRTDYSTFSARRNGSYRWRHDKIFFNHGS